MTLATDHSRYDRLVWLALLLLVATGCAHLAPGIAPIAADPPATACYGCGDTMTEPQTLAAGEPLANAVGLDEPTNDGVPPEVSVYGSPADETFKIDDGSPQSAELESGELIAVDDEDGERYISRQYPKTYPAPPPPTATTVPTAPAPTTIPRNRIPQSTYQAAQPPSVYQLPPGYQNQSGSAAAQLPVPPQTYQPPQIIPLPPGGVPVSPSQPLPAPVSPEPYNPLPYNPAPYQVPGGYPSAPVPLGEFGLSPPGVTSPSFGYSDPIFGNPVDPYAGVASPPPVGYIPNTRTADLEIIGTPARTGRIMFGGAVNSDAGVTGQITIDERNFDITRWPRSFRDLASGTAFRGAGQTLRLEAVPGSQFKRYTASFADPNLFGYLPISFGLSGFLYDRRYNDYDEERLGGRVSLGYRVTPDLSVTTGINGQNVDVSNPRVNTVQELNEVLGDTQLYTGEVRLTHDTRNSPFQPSEGHFFEFGYEKAFGDFDYSRFEIENRNYLLIAERADGSGRQTLALTTRLGFSGVQTPLYENYFAGGYSTMRGFNFRGASPVDQGVQVGGRFQWLNSLEYMFPITADDAFRGVAFCDFGTVERDVELHRDSFRVAPGLGLRISIPLLGPAPLAFDFAYPVSKADTDQRRIFSFYLSTLR